MAITFSKAISITELLNAFNNNVVEFSSDDALDSVKCNININSKDFEITPDTSNVFRFNFLEAVRIFVKQNNFEDSILPTADNVNDTSLINSWLVTYTITLSDDSTDITTRTYVFIRSVEQIAQLTNKLLSSQYLFNPLTLTVFKGYPFEVVRFSNGNVNLSNSSNTLALTSPDNNTERIWLSRGDSIIQGSGGDMIKEGFNDLSFDGSGQIDFTIKMKDVCDGVYLKWANKKSGYSYWLFNSIYKDKISVKTIDVFNVDFDSIDETYTTELPTKRQPTFTKDLVASSLSLLEMEQIKDILDSPRIEMYNGEKDDAVTAASWQTVSIRSASQIVKNTKHSLINFKLKIKVNEYSI